MSRLPLTAVLVSLIILLPLLAHSNVLRYSDEVYGGITMTGNAIGLSKAASSNGPGTEDSIGTFMAMNPADVDNIPASLGTPWPSGTTSAWTKGGSSAELILPSGAEVLFAELIWGGSYNYVGNVTAYLDTTVSISYEGSDTTLVTPVPASSVTLAESSGGGTFTAYFYMRAAEVTSYVQANGPGTYTVGRIPATQHEDTNSLNAAGWALIVVYDDPAEAWPSHVVLRVGGEWIDEDNDMTFTAAGFTSAAAGTVTGHILLGALEGDADLTGDIAELSAPAGTVTLSGTNNPVDNFFASQINDITGALDTSGTFGTRNHNAATGVNTSGGRQGWDITGVPVSSADAQVAQGQTSISVELATTGDSYMPTFFAMQIDSDGVERDISTGGGGGGGCNTAGPAAGSPPWVDLMWIVVLCGVFYLLRRREIQKQQEVIEIKARDMR